MGYFEGTCKHRYRQGTLREGVKMIDIHTNNTSTGKINYHTLINTAFKLRHFLLLAFIRPGEVVELVRGGSVINRAYTV